MKHQSTNADLRYLLLAWGIAWVSTCAVVALTSELALSSPGFKHNETVCLGSADAKTEVVYLHGMDTDRPSAQENKNRQVLNRLAKKLGLRVAIPRSPYACDAARNLRCWRQESEDAVKASLAEIDSQSQSCFAPKSHYSLMGFSNGGFLVGKALQYCLTDNNPWLVSFASSGSWSLHDDRTLNSCGKMTLLVSKRDRYHFESAHRYYERLVGQKAQVSIEDFKDGPDSLNYEVLLKALKKMMPPATVAANPKLVATNVR